MQVRLDKVRDQPYRWDETREIAAEALEDQCVEGVGPVRWSGRVTHTPPGFLLEAEFLAEAQLICDRCLAPFAKPLDGKAELLILLRKATDEGSERELSEEDLGVIEVDEELLDLEPILYELLQLQVPMKPLCRMDCRGLCPTCGTDLNNAPCDCVAKATEPRWAALEVFRERSND